MKNTVSSSGFNINPGFYEIKRAGVRGGDKKYREMPLSAVREASILSDIVGEVGRILA